MRRYDVAQLEDLVRQVSRVLSEIGTKVCKKRARLLIATDNDIEHMLYRRHQRLWCACGQGRHGTHTNTASTWQASWRG